jgi:hypothetical protein
MSAQHWADQQAVFAAALLDPQHATPAFLQVRDGGHLDTRFDVHRNNVHASLIEALRATFPVTARLVGDESFGALARDFLRQQLPQRAALHDYGAELPAFLGNYAPAAPLRWIGDVAALEHAWWQAYGAADAPALPVSALAGMDGATLLALRARLHPAVRLIASEHPVHAIWSAHQQEGEAQPPAQWHAECVLITRPDADVRVQALAPAGHAFIDALRDGATLEAAAADALATDTPFDFGNTLLLALEAGAIEELHP